VCVCVSGAEKRENVNNVLSIIPFHDANGCLLETEELLCRMEEIRVKVSGVLLPISYTFNVADIRDNKP